MSEFKKTSPITLQEQLYQELLKQIQNGTYNAGDKIPPETTLSKQYQVSRVTVRTALKRLVDEQLLVRKPGKGSFVKSPVFVEDSRAGGSFTETCLRMNAKPSTQVILQEITLDTPQLCKKLGDSVIHITRVRCVDGNPCIVEEDYFPSSFRFLLHCDLEKRSLFSCISEQYGTAPARFEDYFKVAHASQEYARLLNCSRGHALLEVTQEVMDRKGALIYINQQYIFSDRYVYVVRACR